MRFSNDLLTMSLLRRRRSRLRDFSCIPWLPPPFERRTRPVPEMRNRLEAARFVFILGTVGSLTALSGAAGWTPDAVNAPAGWHLWPSEKRGANL